IVSGKVELIEAGAYKEVDVSLMVHPTWRDLLDLVYLAVTSAKIEYFGKAKISTSPWNGRNALDVVVLAYNGISLLRQQSQINNRISMFITNGGKVVNVIPDYTSLQVQIRSESVSILQELKSVENCLKSAADATGCTYKTEWDKGCCDRHFGNVGYEVPSIHALYNIGTTHIMHTPEFAIEAEKVEAHHRTLRAATCLALTALDVLVDDQ
ncbi:6293_t:CDS:2, partial [Ambispora gerdemannii]